VSGTLDVADDPLASTLEVDVEVATVDTGEADRDGHLKSADFFDVETYPTMTYRATGLTATGGDDFRVEGELSLHGVTQTVPLDVTFEGHGVDPWGNQRVGFTATGELDREAFGLTWNQALETGGVLVGKTAKVELEAEFVRQ
jgi:polyisoprenoid-binding protein YceI